VFQKTMPKLEEPQLFWHLPSKYGRVHELVLSVCTGLGPLYLCVELLIDKDRVFQNLRSRLGFLYQALIGL
jgi:hypothetical protein